MIPEPRTTRNGIASAASIATAPRVSFLNCRRYFKTADVTPRLPMQLNAVPDDVSSRRHSGFDEVHHFGPDRAVQLVHGLGQEEARIGSHRDHSTGTSAQLSCRLGGLTVDDRADERPAVWLVVQGGGAASVTDRSALLLGGGLRRLIDGQVVLDFVTVDFVAARTIGVRPAMRIRGAVGPIPVCLEIPIAVADAP